LLFAASRSQLVAEVIRPNLSRGVVVICDRSAFSTVAYQGYGRGLDLHIIQAVNAIATQELLPELVILLDIPAEVGLARKRRAKLDRFEREEVAFHQRVRYGYLQLAAADSERWLVINATLPKAEIEQVVWEGVRKLLHNAPITKS
jgi:dTMP kinase